MTSENEQPTWIEDPTHHITAHMQKFKLYETCSNFYIIGRDKNRTFWRILKIDRLEPSELSICEDPVTYLEMECYDLLRRINEGNRSTGGLKFVTTCYGIVGFIKFLGPYYMLLITKRRKIGAICGHAVYAIAKSEIITIPNSTVRSTMTNSKNENRYKKLLCTVDLTKDFFFSYSYHLMLSLQKNLCSNETGKVAYERMFVWNEFLTRGIRNCLSNTLWTVALIYGFFKQVKFSVSARDFKLTLVARRSRHFAGTRYLKRGVNDKGRVANDVETEQIVSEDLPEESLLQISSVVQNRGSIPLFWSQETSRLNIKPDIILSRKDQNYEATRLHFKNLVKRYGNPIIVLNLIKSREKRPRESILRAEFANAIDIINKDLSVESRLKFLHWDLQKQTRNKDANVLSLLGKVAAYALNITGIFYSQVPQSLRMEGLQHQSYSCENSGSDCFLGGLDEIKNDSDSVEKGSSNDIDDQVDVPMKPQLLQKGVLRTNCIDCLDRTNVAQYAYGLVALGHQLHAVGFIDAPNIDLDAPLADDLMGVYEMMGDTLALQYGGSGAHNKIFSERRGQWKAATQSQEFLRTLQRYYNNAYMDAEKQNAINVFLGNFQPRQDKPSLWELDSSQHSNIEKRSAENSRSLYKRSLSDGNILCDSGSPPIGLANVGEKNNLGRPLPGKSLGAGLSESTPLISICESDISFSRFSPSMSTRKLCAESTHMCLSEHGDAFDCSNFLDVECLSSSGNSCEDDTYERSTVTDSPVESLSSENVVNAGSNMKKGECSEEVVYERRGEIDCEYPDSFVDWVTGGALLFY